MKIYNVTDPEFKAYGKVIEGMEDVCQAFLEVLANAEQPADGVKYIPEDPALMELPETQIFIDHCFGGMPTELGWCNGFNRRLNALEYHRDSEFNLGGTDFILLLAKLEQVEDYMLDTADVKAFFVPAGTLVEVYATTLHYAPIHTDASKGFRVMVGLPMGTNTDMEPMKRLCREDDFMLARNKWLLAHPDSDEAKEGAGIGLKGVNIDLGEIS